MEYSTLQAALSSDGVGVSNIIVMGSLIIGAILIAGALWHLWTLFQLKCSSDQPKSKKFEHMYYKIKYRRSPKTEKMETGYLISLSFDEATMIVHGGEPLEKGDNLFLSFDLEAPCANELHKRSFARITKLNRVSNTSSWYINLRFVDRVENTIDLVKKPMKR